MPQVRDFWRSLVGLSQSQHKTFLQRIDEEGVIWMQKKRQIA